MGHAQCHIRRMKDDDPEVDTAQTPKRFGRCLVPMEKIRKTFIDAIPNKYYLKVVSGLNSLCFAFHSAGKGSRLTIGLKHRQRCGVTVLIFLILQFQKGPMQRTYLPYPARVVSSCWFAHNKEWAQSLMVSRWSLKGLDNNSLRRF